MVASPCEGGVKASVNPIRIRRWLWGTQTVDKVRAAGPACQSQGFPVPGGGLGREMAQIGPRRLF